MTTPETVALALLEKIAEAENWSGLQAKAMISVRIIDKKYSTRMWSVSTRPEAKERQCYP
jgi:hypothetical protein